MRKDAVPLVRPRRTKQHGVEQAEEAALPPVPYKTCARPDCQGGAVRLPCQAGQTFGHLQRKAKGIAGCRMEKPAAQPKPPDRVVYRPELYRISADQDRQNACFLTDLLARDIARSRKLAHPVRYRRNRQLWTVAVICIFNQRPVGRQRQDINKTIPIQLRDHGVHDGGAIPFRRRCRKFDPDELLPAKLQPRHLACRAAGINNGARRNPFPRLQDHAIRQERAHLCPQPPAGWRQASPDKPIQRGGGNRIIRQRQHPLALLKAHAVAFPAYRAQRGCQRSHARRNIAVKERPGVIAAEACATLQQQDRQFGASFGQHQRGQSPGQTAACNDKGCARCHEASP